MDTDSTATNASSDYDRRRQEMSRIGKSLLTEFDNVLDCNYLEPGTLSFPLVEKKLSGKPLRGFFVKTFYNYVRSEHEIENHEEHWFFTRQLPLVMENLICIQYYSNQIFDNKGGITTKAAIDENINLKENLEPTLYDYIERNVPERFREKTMRTVREVLRLGAVGQVIEDKLTHYEKWLDGSMPKALSSTAEEFFDREVLDFLKATTLRRVNFPENKRAFLEMYFKKIYLRNAAMYGLFAELILDYCRVKGEKRQSMKRFALYFGLLHQIVNDNADLVPSNRLLTTTEKNHKDAFSDLRNDTLTLPIMIHLLFAPENEMIKILEKKTAVLNTTTEEDMFKEATETHSIYTAMSIGKDIQKAAIALLSPKNNLLFDMCRIAENNKYYRHFYDREADYKAYRKASQRFKVPKTGNPNQIAEPAENALA